jgi:hypothetical protein
MSGQLSLDDALAAPSGPAARASDPFTSHAAGIKGRDRAPNTRLRVLAALVEYWESTGAGLTDDGVASWLEIPPTSAGKRRVELQRAGFVEPADGIGTTRNGAAALLWKPTTAGVELVADLVPFRTVVDVPTGGRL